MPGPCLHIDLDKLERNARLLVERCRGAGTAVVGVTKACCGHPRVARAMLRGGVAGLGDSRLENLERMRAAGIRARCLLLRAPALDQASRAVGLADDGLYSEPRVLRAASRAAAAAGRAHGVVLMVELGDLREGLWPRDVPRVARFVARLPGLELLGVGANLGCLAGALPTPQRLERLVSLARGLRRDLRLPLPVVSGGNSSSLLLLERGGLPRGITQLRLGEAILLGRETACGGLLPGLGGDAFRLEAGVIEVKTVPAAGARGAAQAAAAAAPPQRRALLALGRQDTDPAGLVPLEPGVAVAGASADHLALDVTRAARRLEVGSRVAFGLKHSALVAAMTSPYVTKVFSGGE